uniref:Uncharacterized protein n=1 Tax=Lepeophtheirus salmonis TaxID=72036 RepID=A0A0K2U3A6_LEPSM
MTGSAKNYLLSIKKLTTDDNRTVFSIPSPRPSPLYFPSSMVQRYFAI